MDMSRLTRDGTAEPVSRDQFLRLELDSEILFLSVQLTLSRIGNLIRLILTLCFIYVMTIYIHTAEMLPSTVLKVHSLRITPPRNTILSLP